MDGFSEDAGPMVHGDDEYSYQRQNGTTDPNEVINYKWLLKKASASDEAYYDLLSIVIVAINIKLSILIDAIKSFRKTKYVIGCRGFKDGCFRIVVLLDGKHRIKWFRSCLRSHIMEVTTNKYIIDCFQDDYAIMNSYRRLKEDLVHQSGQFLDTIERYKASKKHRIDNGSPSSDGTSSIGSTPSTPIIPSIVAPHDFNSDVLISVQDEAQAFIFAMDKPVYYKGYIYMLDSTMFRVVKIATGYKI